jgi:hypothetical protein
MTTPKVIGLTGLKRSGKGTAAAGLFPEYVTVSFARSIKNMLLAMGVTEAELRDPETPLPRFNNKTPRFMQQTLGTEWGRGFMGADHWINIAKMAAQAHLDRGVGVVFDDVRFDNEAQIVREHFGGEVWRISRPSCGTTDMHVSEHGVRRDYVHRVIWNTTSPEDLAEEVRCMAALPLRIKL